MRWMGDPGSDVKDLIARLPSKADLESILGEIEVTEREIAVLESEMDAQALLNISRTKADESCSIGRRLAMPTAPNSIRRWTSLARPRRRWRRALFRRVNRYDRAPTGKAVVRDKVAVEKVATDKPRNSVPHLRKRP